MSASHIQDDESEIKSLLWPFCKISEPQTLQDIGFELNLPQGMIHLFVPSSSSEEDPSGQPFEPTQQKNASNGSRKKSLRKGTAECESWMPKGWVKEEKPRPFRGKFPGYVDKKYYAPGVKRAFRSKSEAQRYLKEQDDGNASTAIPSAAETQPPSELILETNDKNGS